MDNLIPKIMLGALAALIVIIVEQFVTRRKAAVARSESGEDSPLPGPSAGADIKRGLLILGLAMVTVVVMVGQFNLNEEEPSWETPFAIVIMGIVPLYALYHIGRGIYKYIQQR